MKSVFFLLIFLLLVPLHSVSASDVLQGGVEVTGSAGITELYSDLESFDITLYSEKAEENLTLEALLVRQERGEEEGLAKRMFLLESLPARTRVIRVGFWDVSGSEDGSYILKARLLQGGEVISEAEYKFVYGRRSIPKLRVNDLIANSEGISVVLSPNEPVLFDIEYMLVDGSEVIYTTKSEKEALPSLPETFSASWGTLLENNRKYLGRVKLQVYSPKKEFITYTQAFTARDDAEITDIFEDESGASATVFGRSQVPFEGSLIFTIYRFDTKAETEVLESVRVRVPVLLAEDDETVEVSWRRRLPEGVYKLEIGLVGNDGDLIERRESIIESDLSGYESVTDPSSALGQGEEVPDEQENEKESVPGFLNFEGVVGTLVIALILSKNRGRR